MPASEPLQRFVRIVAIAVAALPATAELRAAQPGTSADQRLQALLVRRVSLTWQGQQFAVALQRLRDTASVPVWLDRRVDPTARISLDSVDQPIENVLQEIAARSGCGVSIYHGIVYLGPPLAARDLLTRSEIARESLEHSAATARASWLTPRPWVLPRLSEPRNVLLELVKPTGAGIHGLDLVPHDLWPARDLPAMTPLDSIVLTLAGFDLTCTVSADGKGLRITPAPRPATVTRQYTVPSTRRTALDQLLADLDDTNMQHRGQRLTVAARVEDHQRITAVLQGLGTSAARTASSPRRTPAPLAAQRFTLEIKNQPVGRILDQLAAQLKLTIEWDAALSTNPARGREAAVSCAVTQVDLDELLSAILTPVGLKADRAGDRVLVKLAE